MVGEGDAGVYVWMCDSVCMREVDLVKNHTKSTSHIPYTDIHHAHTFASLKPTVGDGQTSWT